jgi:hypothetical protein
MYSKMELLWRKIMPNLIILHYYKKGDKTFMNM